MIQFTSEKSENGVTERIFDLMVLGERVPAVIWSPENCRGERPLILMGHGGSQHKRVGTLAKRAIHYAQKLGYATLAIDAPGHGDRIGREEALQLAREVANRVRGVGGEVLSSPEMRETMKRYTRQAIPEWKAALDAAQSLDFVGNHAAVAYWGLSMGSVIGIPFVANEPRVKCAVFGLVGLKSDNEYFKESANAITIPVELLFQWDDPVVTRDAGIALFDALASKSKSMHIYPGGHLATPSHEGDSWQAFFVRHLSGVVSQ